MAAIRGGADCSTPDDCRETGLRIYHGVELHLAVLDGQNGGGFRGVVELVKDNSPGNRVELDLIEGFSDFIGVVLAGILATNGKALLLKMRSA